MAYPHPIRLHGPWEWEVLRSNMPGEEVAAMQRRLHIPGDWGGVLGAAFQGQVRLRRWFHRPGKLEAHERAWLVCQGVDPGGTIRLNGEELGAAQGYAIPVEFHVTERLLARNNLEIDIDTYSIAGMQGLRPGREGLPGGLLGDIRLEIRAEYFVQGLSLYFDPRSTPPQAVLQGQVMGNRTADKFEIAARGPAGELVYGEVPLDKRFELRGPAEGIPAWKASPAVSGEQNRLAEVEVRLLRGGSRLWEGWYHTAIPAQDNASAQIVNRIDDKYLDDCDQGGQSVVQSIPWQWSGEVCPRLAHHPSIVAWAASNAPRQPADKRPAITFGRQWIYS